jgi:hypothetical protein
MSVGRAQLARDADELVELGQRGAGGDGGARALQAVGDGRRDTGRIQRRAGIQRRRCRAQAPVRRAALP